MEFSDTVRKAHAEMQETEFLSARNYLVSMMVYGEPYLVIPPYCVASIEEMDGNAVKMVIREAVSEGDLPIKLNRMVNRGFSFRKHHKFALEKVMMDKSYAPLYVCRYGDCYITDFKPCKNEYNSSDIMCYTVTFKYKKVFYNKF